MTHDALVLILMGVAGCGKTTVGQALAAALRWPFFDADDFHPPANVAKMAAGTPLTDADREPWLESLRSQIDRQLEKGESAVLTCSALKQRYRDRLQADPTRVHFVHLHGAKELIAQRMQARRGHFMPATLLDSQFAALEAPQDAWIIEIDRPVAAIVAAICARVEQKQ